MIEVTYADIECENGVEWALFQERTGKIPAGEGVTLARTIIAQHRNAATQAALATAQTEAAELRAEVERLRELEAIARDTPEYVCAGIPDEVIEAGIAAREQAEHDMANYVSGVTTDWDEGMIAAAMFRAMLAATLAQGTQPHE